MDTTATKGKVSNFQDLQAWQTSKSIAVKVYNVTKEFPPADKFGFTGQIRRCSLSISSNIAEGFSRKSKKDKNQFYQIALGSITELQSQLEIAFSVELIGTDDYKEISNLAIKAHKLVNGLIKSARDWNVKNT